MVGRAATMTWPPSRAGWMSRSLAAVARVERGQGARIKGAARIVAVTIKPRRELALKVGATSALDPNVEGANLVQKIDNLCGPPTMRGGGYRGRDFAIEAVGGDLFAPKAEVGPDPTRILSLQQAWQLSLAGRAPRDASVSEIPPGRRSRFRRTVGERRQESSPRQRRRRPGQVRSVRYPKLIEAGPLRREVARDLHVHARADAGGLRGRRRIARPSRRRWCSRSMTRTR